MTKYEWETELKKCMVRLPKAEQDKVLAYYNELFADRADDGMSEKQIINEFGNPVDVAFKIMTEYGMDERAPADERKIAPPDFYGKKSGDAVVPPDFWAGRGGRKTAAGERAAASEERKQIHDIRREDKAARREERRESGKRSGEATAAFLIELVILGWLFIGLTVAIWSLVFAVNTIGFSFAAGAVYAVICAVMPGLTVGVRLVEFAAALLLVGIALMIIPNVAKIAKIGGKATRGLWNGLFGWYTKRGGKTEKTEKEYGAAVKGEVA